ncbi:MAG: hypothetical protein A2583_02940 [Bdellovibrionales bacterium RIFOXYD1_FULL_53_11]|nr:MAG: hypothetical protein A2583_02940 [Bdellovibrionales bacterium RIFOXYD1_FULL_53_11]
MVLCALALASLAACSTVTMRTKGTAKLGTTPTFESSKPYFLWGLVGEHHIDIKEICQGKEAVQWQAQNTFLDGLLGCVTLGIYAPRTAKVWCDAGEMPVVPAKAVPAAAEKKKAKKKGAKK